MMQISKAMTADVVSVPADTTLMEAARLMKGLDVGPLPVRDEGRLIGVITDRDITVRATAEGKDPLTTAVRDVMTPNVVYCRQDEDVRDVAKLMQEAQLRRLLVVDGDMQLVGIVSLGDLVLHSGDDLLAGQTLASVSEPREPEES
jgi:CBS domain-containing protein